MSWLAPLYLVGALAVAVPLWLHLVRRRPRNRTRFSSLLFLEETPPRAKESRRFEQILLLCLRALALLLLALAFARPFLRREAEVAAEAQSARIAILLDTSASMRHGDLWQRAQEKATALVDEASALGDPELYTFEHALHAELLPDPSRPAEARRRALRERIATLQPGWGESRLGAAMVELADRLALATEGGAAQIQLVSDLSLGADLSALDAVRWPEGVHVELHPIRTVDGNAGLQLAPADFRRADDPGATWVRVANSRENHDGPFQLQWSTGPRDPMRTVDSLPFHIEPGESRIVRAPDRPSDAAVDRLVLVGDHSHFDDTLYFAPVDPEPRTVVFLDPGGGEGTSSIAEPDADPAAELAFFLEGVFHEELDPPLRLERVERLPEQCSAADGTPMVVLPNAAANAEDLVRLGTFVADGGVVLAVLMEDVDGEPPSAAADSLRALLDEPGVALGEESTADERDRTSDRLLRDLEFGHPLLAPFADPRFRDFTGIRFWRARTVHLPENSDIAVLARFDDGHPWLLERPRGAGRVFVLTSSWSRLDSDLARSSKFPPLLLGIAAQAWGGDRDEGRLSVGERLPIPPHGSSSLITWTQPDGSTQRLGADGLTAPRATAPGVHHVTVDGRTASFAVQLAAEESRIDPLPLTAIEQRMGAPTLPKPSGSTDRARQQRSAELENRQKLWRWLVLGATAVLLTETVYAARRSRGPARDVVPGSAS